MRARMAIAGCLVAGALLLAACAGNSPDTINLTASRAPGTGAHAGARVHGGTVTWAEMPSVTPNFIYPFMPADRYSVANIEQFQYMMYRPLFWFGTGKDLGLNDAVSLAGEPKFADGLKAVHINLKHYVWSDGERLSATDVLQWLNMAHAEKSNWHPYIRNVGIPDAVTNVTVNSATRLTIRLSGPIKPLWFLYNMLSQITPMPEAWDITHTGAAPGSGGCGAGAYGTAATDGACRAVWNYMVDQAGYDAASPNSNNALASYATNPLWQVVDGPWRLRAFNPDGEATFIPNRKFSGRRATISAFVEVPFASQGSEMAALTNGQLTMGYVPFSALPKATPHPRKVGRNNRQLAKNFTLVPLYTRTIDYIPYNYNSTGDNGVAGAIFKQLYFRQAFQTLINQPKIVKRVDNGYALATYFPVPAIIPSESRRGANPYLYDQSNAVELLASHGWNVAPNGLDTCLQPGTGSDDCGAGIPSGAALNFTLEYSNSTDGAAAEMAMEAASWASIGIKVTLVAASPQDVLHDAAACSAGPSCTWELAYWGTGSLFAPNHYPTGEQIFATAAPFNNGSYSSPIVDNLTQQLQYTNANPRYYKTYLARELPVAYEPEPATYLWEVDKKLRGVTPFDVFENNDPERYYFVN